MRACVRACVCMCVRVRVCVCVCVLACVCTLKENVYQWKFYAIDLSYGRYQRFSLVSLKPRGLGYDIAFYASPAASKSARLHTISFSQILFSHSMKFLVGSKSDFHSRSADLFYWLIVVLFAFLLI